MENRHAIRLRNIIVAFWAGFGLPSGCIALLVEDRYQWIDQHPGLATLALAIFFGPLVFIAFLEIGRRKSKRLRQKNGGTF
jgi:hypothetical protein